jgi:hypothetical protein
LKQNLFSLFSIFFISASVAQTQEQTIAMGMEQVQLKNYDAATAFFLRSLYFEQGNKRAFLYQQLGDCYFGSANYEKAAYSYELGYSSEINDSVKTELLFKKTSALLLQEKYQYALAELYSLADSMPSIYFNRKKNFYLGIACFGNNEFALSEKSFLAALPNNSITEAEQIKGIFLKNKKVGRVKPKTARILSMCLPGLGQFYAGDIKNGFNSLIINALFVGLFTYSFITISPVDAYFSVLPWFQRYYKGGYTKAGIIANERVKQKRKLLYNEIITIIAKQKE